MAFDQQATSLVVLSDLHLAPAGEQCVFADHVALVSLINRLAATPGSQASQWLVLNGDVFDFLLIPGYDSLSLPLAAQRMGQILDSLEAEPAAGNVVAALRGFTDAGHILCCLPGNHDAELNLATVQAVLAQRLGSSALLPPSRGYWKLIVAGQHVVGLHGHHTDPFNAIGGDRMNRAQAAGDETVPMPPGSRLVCEVINPFRRAKAADGTHRFPFVDRLPSEHAVILAIMLLDPRLAERRLGRVLNISAAALLRKAAMATGVSRAQLGSRSNDEQNTPTNWTQELLAHMVAGITDQTGVDIAAREHLDYSVDAYFKGTHPGAECSGTHLAGGGQFVRRLLLGALARALDASRPAFDSGQTDRLAERVTEGWGNGTIAVTGHTHAPKWIPRPDDGCYLNTGSWLPQVLPPRYTSPEALGDWLERLRHDQLPCWRARPVAVIDDQGPRLMRWTRDDLKKWQDPTDFE